MSFLTPRSLDAIKQAYRQGYDWRAVLVFGTVEGELMRPRNLRKAWWRVRSSFALGLVSTAEP
jgi:predicted pyridoxine 5'-phosphate oxidase superfamily flavin-nucleotide-binding protein